MIRCSDAAFEGVHETLTELVLHIDHFTKSITYSLDRLILSSNLGPTALIASTVAITLLAIYWLLLLKSLYSSRGEAKALLYGWIRRLPLTQSLIRKEKKKLISHLEGNKKKFLQDEKPITSLPVQGWSSYIVLSHLRQRLQGDADVSERESRVSGTVYMKGSELDELLCESYKLHSKTNPLHPDVFPSVRQMEAEVVHICGTLLNRKTSARNVCGCMTSGGSESILLAVKASRDFVKEKRKITEPEMIICESAHASYYKAAEYFGIRLVVLKADKQFKFPVSRLKGSINENTMLIVASAPGFPHGIIDPIKEMAEIALRTGTLLHVDCCLGGFFLPFARELGLDVPPFDFDLKGVTSISIDTHKYGMAHKGTSVILYRSPRLRQHQYTAVSDWTGGLYISPGFSGSRSGALIATAWASLMYNGLNGYLQTTQEIVRLIEEFKKKIKFIPDLKIIGDPIGPVVAVRMKQRPNDIYRVNDVMTEKKWHLTPLQFPPALHITFTARHVDVIDRLVQDLRVAVSEAKSSKDASKGGTAAIYGTACVVPDRRIVKDLLMTYQDTLLAP